MLLTLYSAFSDRAVAEEPAPQNVRIAAAVTTEANPTTLPPEETREALQWAADWVCRMLPETYRGEKNWGKTTRAYAGFKVSTSGGKLSTRRRWKELNHGRWLRYEVCLHDPTEPGRVSIQIVHAQQDETGRIHFTAQVDSIFDVDVHQERWSLGTRLWSVSVDAEAAVRMVVSGEVGFDLDLTRIPPDVVADPHVNSAELALVDLHVRKVSKIGGEVAEAVGDVAKRIIRDEYLPRHQAELKDKLNSQIDRRRSRLRFGASDWLQKTITAPNREADTPDAGS